MTDMYKSLQVFVEPGYESLVNVLVSALDQAQGGKGKERHQIGLTPFNRQPICEIGRMVGPGFNAGQAIKKAQEAMRLPSPERQVAELLGAINYLAATVILIQEKGISEADLKGIDATIKGNPKAGSSI
jgi:hypothetical protein